MYVHEMGATLTDRVEVTNYVILWVTISRRERKHLTMKNTLHVAIREICAGLTLFSLLGQTNFICNAHECLS